MIGLLATQGLGLVQILLTCVPSTLLAVVIAALVQMRVGRELKDDPEYRRRLQAGEVQAPGRAGGGDLAARAPLKPGAQASAGIFFGGVALIVLAGIFPALRTVPGLAGEPVVIGMPESIALLMLAGAAVPWWC